MLCKPNFKQGLTRVITSDGFDGTEMLSNVHLYNTRMLQAQRLIKKHLNSRYMKFS